MILLTFMQFWLILLDKALAFPSPFPATTDALALHDGHRSRITRGIRSSALAAAPVEDLARLSTETSFLNDQDVSRREVVRCLGSAAALYVSLGGSVANSEVTDETEAVANTARDSAYAGLNVGSNTPKLGATQQSKAVPSDEVSVSIAKSELTRAGGLGIELGEVTFRTNIRVFVKTVARDSLATKLGIKKDWIVVAVNNDSAERTNAEGVAIQVSRAVKSMSEGDKLTLRFRDPAVFRENLQDLSKGGEVTTEVAPAGDTTQRNEDGSVKRGTNVTEQESQKLTVVQLIPPKMCTRGATTDDLLEISYIGTVVETGEIFDGSTVKINGQGIPGRGGDVSLFFVLGKQPFGQFPPGWDVGLQGMCVGERRRLIIPPVLAYGSSGVPRRRIPPDSTLQYDITLVSLNGLATPQ